MNLTYVMRGVLDLSDDNLGVYLEGAGDDDKPSKEKTMFNLIATYVTYLQTECTT